jgi:predicted ATPase
VALVERDPILDRLHDAWLGAAAGGGAVVVLDGEAGVGKTSVVTAAAARVRDARVSSGRSTTSPARRVASSRG